MENAELEFSRQTATEADAILNTMKSIVRDAREGKSLDINRLHTVVSDLSFLAGQLQGRVVVEEKMLSSKTNELRKEQ